MSSRPARTETVTFVFWVTAYTEVMSWPAARAVVTPSWYEIPKSALWPAIRVSGAVEPYGTILRSIPASLNQPFCWAT